MTLGQMVEYVQTAFPDARRQKLVFELNDAMRTFCFDTGILMTSRILDRDTDYLSTDTDGVETWQMPVDTYRVLSIDELYFDQFELQDDELKFLPAENAVHNQLLVRYTRVPSVLSSNAESPSFPEEFHMAPVYAVMASYYRRSGDMNNASAEMGAYREMEKKARRYVLTARYRNVSAFAGDSMANKVAFGTQALSEGENTVALGKTFTSVSSFVAVFNTADVEEVIADRTTSTIKVTASKAISDFAFFAYGT